MEVIEDTLDADLDEFLSRPLFCFLGTVSADGDPRVSPLWFLWEDGAAWIVADSRKTYPDRVERHPETALAVVDFDRTTGRVQHVGMRGRATVEPHDPERVIRLLTPYLGPDMDEWDESRFPDPHEWGEEMATIRFEPDTVVARDQSYAPTPSARGDSE
jgi:nitroimidazol reductase NimA-like FMN-containing flavoprotein (pyridoxamine 5'-phosphate oxidase superfamily)